MKFRSDTLSDGRAPEPDRIADFEALTLSPTVIVIFLALMGQTEL